ncbi:hypothetical protein AB0L10_03920 [Streptomyces flaveolus]|uniref:hypothetical protein n=1 Tax=Streptomyces flaveolus TaxID=67297 RepID=UPI003443A1DA
MRVKVTDTLTERVPVLSAADPSGDAESGRLLLIVAGLTTQWTVAPRESAQDTTVWAELDLASAARDSAMVRQVHANGRADEAHWTAGVSAGR